MFCKEWLDQQLWKHLIEDLGRRMPDPEIVPQAQTEAWPSFAQASASQGTDSLTEFADALEFVTVGDIQIPNPWGL